MTDYMGMYSQWLDDGRLAGLSESDKLAMEDLCRAASIVDWGTTNLMVQLADGTTDQVSRRLAAIELSARDILSATKRMWRARNGEG